MPFTFALVASGLRVAHQRQAPFFKLVYRGIDVARHIVSQIFAHHTHQVVARVTHMVFGLVFVPLHTHVAVDCVQTLRNRTTSINIGFLGNDDPQIAPPVTSFISSTGSTHATTDDEDIAFFKNCIIVAH